MGSLPASERWRFFMYGPSKRNFDFTFGRVVEP